MNNMILLRGEHLSNLRRYVLEGVRLPYSETYGKAFSEKHDAILRQIVPNPEQKVKVVATTDDICNSGVCPKKGDRCQSAKLAEKDKAIANMFNLSVDTEYSASEVIQAVSRPIENYDDLRMSIINSLGL